MADSESQPAPADLVAYVEGRATAKLAREIEDHLAICPESRELVAALRGYDLEPMPSAGTDALHVDAEEIDSALLSVLASLPEADEADEADDAESSDSPGSPPEDEVTRSRREAAERARPSIGWRELSITLPWAALILVAIGWGISERRDRVAPGLQETIANVPILALQEVGNPLRSPSSGEVSISNGALITLADERPFPAGPYTASITKEPQEVILEIGGLEPRSAGHLSFFLPPDSLSPGRHEVILSSPDGTPWPRRFVLQVAP